MKGRIKRKVVISKPENKTTETTWSNKEKTD
jgi:hypothetical protein